MEFETPINNTCQTQDFHVSSKAKIKKINIVCKISVKISYPVFRLMVKCRLNLAFFFSFITQKFFNY